MHNGMRKAIRTSLAPSESSCGFPEKWYLSGMRWSSLCFVALFSAGCATTQDDSITPKPDTGGADSSVDTGADVATDTPSDATCTATQTKCSGVCVDTKTDGKNCGACAKACTSGQTCESGTCTCTASSTKCGTDCVDTKVDTKNCGGCGKACSTGQTCEAGVCTSPCPTGQTKCGTKCVDTTSDSSNCGACDKPCPTGQACVASACAVSCDLPKIKCTDKCVDPGFDADNCGGCGKKCASGPKSTPACSSSACLLICDTGYGNCNDKSDDGCESDFATDAKNCGGCGKACATTETCSAGACKCAGGGTKCPDGACADLTSDVTHCGSCTKVCGSNQVCTTGSCVCKPGYVLCGDTCFATSCPPTGFIGSSMITTTDSTLLNTWVGSPGATWTRCYSRALDGASSSTFHTKCDGRGATISVAKLNTSGTIKIIGGYTPISWATSGTVNNTSTFLFSLTNSYQHVYRGSPSSYTQYNGSTYGPTFGGGHDLTFSSTMGAGYCYMGYTFKCRTGLDGGTDTTCRNDFCGSYSSWIVEDLEVWYK